METQIQHTNIQCKLCLNNGENQLIIGIRWKCINCENYDCCQKCYEKLVQSKGENS